MRNHINTFLFNAHAQCVDMITAPVVCGFLEYQVQSTMYIEPKQQVSLQIKSPTTESKILHKHNVIWRVFENSSRVNRRLLHRS